MKKLLSTLLLIVMLCQVLPFDAMATVGKVLTDDELARVYALTGLGQHDGLYHNGMMPNASMSGMQLARWLESQLDNQVHTIDDVFARARYQLDVQKERYPASTGCSYRAPSMTRQRPLPSRWKPFAWT